LAYQRDLATDANGDWLFEELEATGLEMRDEEELDVIYGYRVHVLSVPGNYGISPANRGGNGVKTINITEKTGELISIQSVTDDNDLMIINRSGVTIRTEVSQIRLAGRATQGVRIINLREGDAIASVMAVPASEEEETVANEEGTVVADNAETAGVESADNAENKE